VPLELNAGTYTQGDVTLPRLDAIAARDAEGALWLSVTNLDPQRPAQLDIRVDGMEVASASGQVLTAPSVDAHNTFEAAETVRPRDISAQARGGVLRLELPSKSVAVVRLNRGQ
jgi:alpha-N-arabinofuranosidase